MCVVVFLVTVDFHSERLSPSKLSFFFHDGENDLAVLRRSLTGGFREKAFGGPPPLEVHYSPAHTECTRKPHLYSLFSHDSRSTCIRKNTHTHAGVHRHTAQWQGPSCCPKAWNTTFVCLRLVFFPWTLLTFILQLKVLEVPPAVGETQLRWEWASVEPS